MKRNDGEENQTPGSASLSSVMSRLRSSNKIDRENARRSLVQRGMTSTVVNELRIGVLSEDIDFRDESLLAFEGFGELAIPPLKELMDPAYGKVRGLVLRSLGRISPTRERDAFSVYLDDADKRVRSSAVRYLAGSAKQDDDTVGLLSARLESETSAAVAQSILDAMNTLELAPDPSRLHVYLSDPLCGGVALELLCRTGEVGPLATRLRTSVGLDFDHAIAGFGHAWEVGNQKERTTLMAMEADRQQLERSIRRSVGTALLGALRYTMLHDLWGLVVVFAERADAASHLFLAHNAIECVRSAEMSKELAQSARAMDPVPAAILIELSTAAIERGPILASPSPEPVADETNVALRFFSDHAGLELDSRSAARFVTRLGPLARRAKMTLSGYLTYVQSNAVGASEELARALQRITIHETYFFRENKQLETLRMTLLPHIRTLKGGEDPHILSAGCSTGEEVYSIGMMLMDEGLSKFSLTGVDIGKDSIATARDGKYALRAFKGTLPDSYREKYFITDAEALSVVPRLRSHCTFLEANLVDPEVFLRFPRFHVAFCRNMLIYLHDDARTAVIHSIYERLRPGGVLFLGHSESLFNIETDFRFVPATDSILYIKPMPDGSVPDFGEKND